MEKEVEGEEKRMAGRGTENVAAAGKKESGRRKRV